MVMRADSSNREQYRELEHMMEYVSEEWGYTDNVTGPTFLWDPTISDCAQDDDMTRHDTPVAPLEQAEQVMTLPMQWYFDGITAITPTAEHTERGIEIPRIDMPSFTLDSEALAGVSTVVTNAVSSTRWLESTRNLCRALELTAHFISACEDRHQECMEYLKDIIVIVRTYMDAVARHAEPEVSAQALRLVTQVACNEDFRINTTPMMDVLSCALSFAQWDDTRIFAYEALDTASAVMDDMVAPYRDIVDTDQEFRAMMTGAYAHEFADLDGVHDNPYTQDFAQDPNNAQELELYAYDQFTQAKLLLRHDLLRLSGDIEEADQLLYEHSMMAPLADAYAARLILTERWHDLLAFVDTVEARNPAQFTMMFPENLVPYDWDSIREIALQALNDREQLQQIYRDRIIGAFDIEDMAALNNLRRVSNDIEWESQVEYVVEQYHEQYCHDVRNPVYEHLLVMQELRDEAIQYIDDFPDAWPVLASIL